MHLIAIGENPEDNEHLAGLTGEKEILLMTIHFFRKVGYAPPWIGYYVEDNGEIVGSAAFKGPPVNGKVEIAYGTFDNFRKRGIATAVCQMLVQLSLDTDPSVRITARTLEISNYSIRVLEKNNFVCLGIVNDPEDGDVLEWEYVR